MCPWAAPVSVRVQVIEQRRELQGFGEQITLAIMATQAGENLGLAFLLDALGNQLQLQALAELDDGLHDAPTAGALLHLADEADVDFQPIDVELLQVAER